MSAAEKIIALLDGVERTCKGWRARCPACGGRNSKVSISEGDDGRALMHCFAGCSALAVVQALNLTLADLFPERMRDDSPESRRKMVRAAMESQWGAALDLLDFEAEVICGAARSMSGGRTLDSEDNERLVLAASRVSNARQVLRKQPSFRPPSIMR